MQRVLFPIRLKFGIMFLLLLLATGAFLVGFFPGQMSEAAEKWALRGGTGTAEVLASAMAPAVDFELMGVRGSKAQIRELLGQVKGRAQSGVEYAAVLRADGSVLTHEGYNTDAPSIVALTENTASVVASDVLHVAVPIRSKMGDVVAHLLVGFSLRELAEERKHYRDNVLIVSLVLLLIGMAVTSVLGTIIVRPIRQLTEATAAIVSRGDLSQGIDIRTNDEVGQLATSFSQMVTKLRSIPETLNDLVRGLLELIGQVSDTAATLSAGATVLRGHVTGTAEAMFEMNESLQEVGRSVEELQRNADRGAQSNERIATTTVEVRDSVTKLVSSATATHSAIEQMLTSMQSTSRSIAQVDRSLDNTSSAMRDIAHTVASVERSAQDTAELSDEVSRDSELGVGAMEATLGGIDRIRDSSQTASNVMSKLDDQVSEIDRILDGITSITDQTNLLALNAAITAAQAGEHGRGFAVVAGEIKALASSTATSTAEVGELLQGIQGLADASMGAMQDGQRSVQDGVVLGKQAFEALQRNYDTARRATEMVQSIAQSARGQATATNRVSQSVSEIAEAVQRLSTESTRQAEGSDAIMRLTEQMRQMTAEVHESSEEQAKRAREVAEAVSSIGSVATRVSAAQFQQSSAAQRVLHTVESVERVANEQSRAFNQLDDAMESLKQRTDKLRDAVGQFVV